MDSIPAVLLLIFFLFTTATATATAAVQNHQQMENILDTLVGAGDFGNWASILSSGDPSILPVTATLFIPSNSDYDVTSSGTSHLSPFLLFPYHIVPNRLSFTDLRKLPINTRIPTLLPGFSLLITNNSELNFTIDGVILTHPNLYQNAALTAHGVAAPFDYTIYGNFDFRGVYGNSTIVSARHHPQPPTRPRRRPPGRPSGSHEGVMPPTSGSSSLLLGNISWFSGILLLACVLDMATFQMGVF